MSVATRHPLNLPASCTSMLARNNTRRTQATNSTIDFLAAATRPARPSSSVQPRSWGADGGLPEHCSAIPPHRPVVPASVLPTEKILRSVTASRQDNGRHSSQIWHLDLNPSGLDRMWSAPDHEAILTLRALSR